MTRIRPGAFALPAALRTSPRDGNRVRYNISLVANSLTANGYVLQDCWER